MTVVTAVHGGNWCAISYNILSPQQKDMPGMLTSLFSPPKLVPFSAWRTTRCKGNIHGECTSLDDQDVVKTGVIRAKTKSPKHKSV